MSDTYESRFNPNNQLQILFHVKNAPKILQLSRFKEGEEIIEL